MCRHCQLGPGIAREDSTSYFVKQKFSDKTAPRVDQDHSCQMGFGTPVQDSTHPGDSLLCMGASAALVVLLDGCGGGLRLGLLLQAPGLALPVSHLRIHRPEECFLTLFHVTVRRTRVLPCHIFSYSSPNNIYMGLSIRRVLKKNRSTASVSAS